MHVVQALNHFIVSARSTTWFLPDSSECSDTERPEIRVETVLPALIHKSSSECRLSLCSLFCESKTVFSWEGNEKHSTTCLLPFISKGVNKLFFFFLLLVASKPISEPPDRLLSLAEICTQIQGDSGKDRWINSDWIPPPLWYYVDRIFFNAAARPGERITPRLHCLHSQWFFLPPLSPITLRAM